MINLELTAEQTDTLVESLWQRRTNLDYQLSRPAKSGAQRAWQAREYGNVTDLLAVVMTDQAEQLVASNTPALLADVEVGA